ncbi:hypothetical protein [Streptomyces sp. NPDC005423]|uniref:hypothetical protein n=1 Tax=Streptomyces sp. NPDC005423 TaxID=3155343 RepID=UPI0033A33B87
MSRPTVGRSAIFGRCTELLGHPHIGVTAGVYAHVRLRLQRDAINTLSTALGNPESTETENGDGDKPLPCAVSVR